MRNAIRTALLGLFGVVAAGFAQAHTHEYGGWIIDRCAALTGVGVRHHVCKTCGEGRV